MILEPVKTLQMVYEVERSHLEINTYDGGASNGICDDEGAVGDSPEIFEIKRDLTTKSPRES